MLRAQQGLGCSLPSVQLQMSLEDSSAPLSSCQLFFLSHGGTPKDPRKKAVLACTGQELLMRQLEGVMHSWLMQDGFVVLNADTSLLFSILSL